MELESSAKLALNVRLQSTIYFYTNSKCV